MAATTRTWSEVKELLAEAIELPAVERASFLDRVCTADPALRGELESLLSASDALPNDFMAAAAPLLADVNLELEEGGMFAEHFRLVRRLERAAWAKCGWPNKPPLCGVPWLSS